MRKRRPKKTARDKDYEARVSMHAAGFRDGVENERIGIVARLRICGLDELADALESDDRFNFAVAAFRLRDHAAVRKLARERAGDAPTLEERQLGLFDGRGSARAPGAVTKRRARKQASSSARSSVSGSSSRKARKARI